VRVYAVVNGDDGGVCTVSDAQGRDVALVATEESLLPTMRDVTERSRAAGLNVELKEFDVSPPYLTSKPLGRTEGAKALGEKPHPLCRCENGMAAMCCPSGHLTECHYPMNCREARCAHLERV
jgi:hypothetical protein